MPAPNATVQTELDQPLAMPRWVAYLDIDTDPMRAVSALYDKTFSGTGDTDLDGILYESLNSDLTSIGEVQHGAAGSESVRAALSGLILQDTALLNLIGDRTKWQGRTARLWWYLEDMTTGAVVGSQVWPYYTGRMVQMNIIGSPEQQSIILTIEGYLSSLAGATGRTWAQQKEYDSGDLSAQATVAIANGLNTGTTTGVQGAPRGGGVGGTFGDQWNIDLR